MELGLEAREEIADEIYPDVCSILEKKETIRETLEACLRLKEEKPEIYEALHMSCVEEMSDKEIGRELNIKASLVGKRRQRGRAWLKEHCEAYKEKGS